jgi:hypothetical protein
MNDKLNDTIQTIDASVPYSISEEVQHIMCCTMSPSKLEMTFKPVTQNSIDDS